MKSIHHIKNKRAATLLEIVVSLLVFTFITLLLNQLLLSILSLNYKYNARLEMQTQADTLLNEIERDIKSADSIKECGGFRCELYYKDSVIIWERKIDIENDTVGYMLKSVRNINNTGAQPLSKYISNRNINVANTSIFKTSTTLPVDNSVITTDSFTSTSYKKNSILVILNIGTVHKDEKFKYLSENIVRQSLITLRNYSPSN